MEQPIQVEYKATSKAFEANQWLQEINQYDLISCDFEVAVKYTSQELESAKECIENCTNKREWQKANSIINATALDHPSHTAITHCSIGISDHEVYVFILDNKQITDRILSFLTTTTQRQVWHNASFDFKHILYHTGKMPLVYEDTQILAKTIINNADNQQSLTGLKHLAGHRYGQWAISTDDFTIDRMYDDHVLHYAAIDAAATYWLWNAIQEKLNEQ